VSCGGEMVGGESSWWPDDWIQFLPLLLFHFEVLCSWTVVLPIPRAVMSQSFLTVPSLPAADW